MTLISYMSRSVLKVSGPDAESFLQSLITQDISLLKQQPILFTALLTPQGRYLFDFFIFQQQDVFYCLVDCQQIGAMVKRLSLYKLRSNVHLEDLSSSFYCYRGSSENIPVPFFFAPDPRHPSLPPILISSCLLESAAPESTYTQHRYQLAIAEGPQELTPDKSIILEYHFDDLGALSWSKGCYMGQELMARTKHRGGIHKQCCGLDFKETPTDLEPGAPIVLEEQQIGKLIKVSGQYGLAQIRTEYFEALTQNDHQATLKNTLVGIGYFSVSN